ncbi:MAG: MATE family efflux transporter [Clostridiales bacterium]|nr:MATE family efflux transporter [Clostridiales bacterium]
MTFFRRLNRGPDFYRYLWKLSIPIILQNLITFSLGLIDTFMVSQLGNTEMAAVTTANVPVFLLISIVFGIQSGLGILVSQYWGKKDMASINRAVGVAAFLGTGFALILAIIFFLWPVAIMDLLSNEHQLSVMGAPYLRLIGFSYVFNMLSSVYASAQRSVENPNFGMKLFGFSTLLNTGLNYLLIFGHWGFPALGITGAAIATLLARVAEFVICVIYAMRCKAMPFLSRCFFHPGKEMVRKFIKYSSPVVINEAAWGLGNSMLTVILGYTRESVQMLAANAVMGNIHRLCLVVCFGIGAATAVIVGKAIGEEQSHRQVMDLSIALLQFAFLVGLGLSFVFLLMVPSLFVPVIFPLFKLTGGAAAIATALAVTGFAAISLHAYSISAITGVLRSGGDVRGATALDLAPQWLVCVPLTALCALVFHTGYWPICIAMQSECLFKVPLCIARVRSGKWIHDVTGREADEQ